MRVYIAIDAGEREAEFVRKPITHLLGVDPSAALADHLTEAYGEAREWLERKRPLTHPEIADFANTLHRRITAVLADLDRAEVDHGDLHVAQCRCRDLAARVRRILTEEESHAAPMG